jgi:hypothetical protein
VHALCEANHFGSQLSRAIEAGSCVSFSFLILHGLRHRADYHCLDAGGVEGLAVSVAGNRTWVEPKWPECPAARGLDL